MGICLSQNIPYKLPKTTHYGSVHQAFNIYYTNILIKKMLAVTCCNGLVFNKYRNVRADSSQNIHKKWIHSGVTVDRYETVS